MAFDLVSFDLDGTLVDTAEIVNTGSIALRGGVLDLQAWQAGHAG